MTVELPQAVRFVLDTDSVTYHQLGRDAIIQRLGLLPANNVATTVVTIRAIARTISDDQS